MLLHFIAFLQIKCSGQQKNDEEITLEIQNLEVFYKFLVSNLTTISENERKNNIFKKIYIKSDQDTSPVVSNAIYLSEKLDHNNVLGNISHSIKNNILSLMSEDAKFTLSSYLKSDVNEMNLLEQLLEGISYIHSRNISHNNLNLENVFVNSDGILKIFIDEKSNEYLEANNLSNPQNSIGIAVDLESKRGLFFYEDEYKTMSLAEDIYSVGTVAANIFKCDEFLKWFLEAYESNKRFYYRCKDENEQREHQRDFNLQIKNELEKNMADHDIVELIISCFSFDYFERPTAEKLLESFKMIKSKNK
ncbi:serine/threonine protein kinase [Anncaliia algerae PRA339]|uniref:non-specific serine/threonine protein kinase n=1 Tax=Anncaliia algerae PRA339 TaxID=1288291 RepID=A0A059EYC9_9MICR|nr:serine/threonine protein kinase [Anncaliia algerae PRA339]